MRSPIKKKPASARTSANDRTGKAPTRAVKSARVGGAFGSQVLDTFTRCSVIYNDAAMQNYIFKRYGCPVRFAMLHWTIHTKETINTDVLKQAYMNERLTRQDSVYAARERSNRYKDDLLHAVMYSITQARPPVRPPVDRGVFKFQDIVASDTETKFTNDHKSILGNDRYSEFMEKPGENAENRKVCYRKYMGADGTNQPDRTSATDMTNFSAALIVQAIFNYKAYIMEYLKSLWDKHKDKLQEYTLGRLAVTKTNVNAANGGSYLQDPDFKQYVLETPVDKFVNVANMYSHILAMLGLDKEWSDWTYTEAYKTYKIGNFFTCASYIESFIKSLPALYESVFQLISTLFGDVDFLLENVLQQSKQADATIRQNAGVLQGLSNAKTALKTNIKHAVAEMQKLYLKLDIVTRQHLLVSVLNDLLNEKLQNTLATFIATFVSSDITKHDQTVVLKNMMNNTHATFILREFLQQRTPMYIRIVSGNKIEELLENMFRKNDIRKMGVVKLFQEVQTQVTNTILSDLKSGYFDAIQERIKNIQEQLGLFNDPNVATSTSQPQKPSNATVTPQTQSSPKSNAVAVGSRTEQTQSNAAAAVASPQRPPKSNAVPSGTEEKTEYMLFMEYMIQHYPDRSYEYIGDYYQKLDDHIFKNNLKISPLELLKVLEANNKTGGKLVRKSRKNSTRKHN